MNKGFTLIEIIIVLAIIAVLAAVILVGIDPADKINAANDSKVQSDINAIAKALESNAVNNNGTYLTGAGIQAALVISGDLKQPIAPPSGYNCDGVAPPADTDYYFPGTAADGQVVCQLKSKKFVSNPSTDYWKWCSSRGKANAVADPAVGNCPL